MTIFERIDTLAKKQGKTVKVIAKEANLSENAIYAWKKTKPKAEDLALVADRLHTTIDYLLGREEMPVVKEPIDLADLVDENKVDWDEWVSFDGKPLTDEVKTAFKLILGKRLED